MTPSLDSTILILMKRFLVLFSTLFLFFTTINSADALAEKSIALYPGPDQLSGETHNYSLVLKGNGNSVVLGRINFTNTDSEELTNYEMEFPNSQIENLVVYQEIPRPVCVEYSPVLDRTTLPPACVRYQSPTYPDPYNSDYKKLEAAVDGNKISVTFAQKVKEASLSGLVLSFNSTKTVEKEWGKYKFSFETPKVKNTIQDAQVSITTDNKSLYLQVDKESVNYEPNPELATASLAGSDAISKVAPMIGNGGRAFKSASNLTPGETLQVKGSYSDNLFLMNLEKIGLFMLIIFGLLLVIFLLIKINLSGKLASLVENRVTDSKNLVLAEALVSFVASLLVFGVVLLTGYLMRNSYTIFPQGDDILFLLIMIVVLGLILLLVGAPGIIFGVKFGWRHLFSYLAFEFFWLIILIFTYALIFLPFQQGRNTPIPYLMETTKIDQSSEPQIVPEDVQTQ